MLPFRANILSWKIIIDVLERFALFITNIEQIII